jgi:hypothetical protein
VANDDSDRDILAVNLSESGPRLVTGYAGGLGVALIQTGIKFRAASLQIASEVSRTLAEYRPGESPS